MTIGPPCANESIPVTPQPVVEGYGENALIFTPSQQVSPACDAALEASGSFDTAHTVNINNVRGGGPSTYTYTATIIQTSVGQALPNARCRSEGIRSKDRFCGGSQMFFTALLKTQVPTQNQRAFGQREP